MPNAPGTSRSSWNEQYGTVSQEFDEWTAVDLDIRAFLRLTHRWAQDAYNVTWQNAEKEYSHQFDPERHDPDGYVEVFEQKVEGLLPKDDAWMVNAAALRDSVTAFEVYLEKSAHTILKRFSWTTEGKPSKRLRFRKKGSFDSPTWGALVQVYAYFDLEIDTEEVKYVRGIRHLLTHQRGELRTQEKRDTFAAEIASSDSHHLFGPPNHVPLSAEQALEMMDTLTVKVREIDPAIWAYVYGRDQLPREILSLTTGKSPVLELIDND